ncbi:MAG TPA: lipopolysaccharide heptosyltransferase II [Gammaproteobacteria bacterium]|nr:lipopolysaccharide heptosyltransferase II [Gammaproteobacteria bacterium]
MSSPNKNKKILVVAPAWVGDMVMTQTLFQVIKQQHPDAIIDVLAPAWTQGLLERMPEVHQSFISAFKHGELRLWQRLQLARQLRSNHYSQVIILPNSFKSALIPFFSAIPQRTAWRGEWPRFCLVNDARTLDEQHLPLMVQRFAALGLPKNACLPDPLPMPLLNISSEKLNAALQKLQLPLPKRPLLALAPGAEFGPSKRWPASHFAEVAKAKLAQNWDVWLFGSGNDSAITQEIYKLTDGKVVDLTGKTTLAEAVDLLSLATAVISNDSGLMHIAAALKKPLVAIYGSTSPKFTPPLSDKVVIVSLDLSCSPCFQRVCPLGHWRCMLDLKPEEILAGLERLGV